MKKFAVILSGCGHLDGTEIREAVATLLSIEELNAEYQCFAPDIEFSPVNHITKQTEQERNILSESARIARGKIKNISLLKPEEFDGLILPGGYGAVNNLSNFTKKSEKLSVIEQLSSVITRFFEQNKPIGAICISPVLLAITLRNKASLMLTLGEESNSHIINDLGGKHVTCKTDDFVKDSNYNIFSTSAYMRDDRLNLVYKGIFNMIHAMVKL